MTESEATTFLQTCCKWNENPAEMDGLLADLGRLPLAIEQAGEFIRTHCTTIAEYRKLYNKNKSKALDTGLSDTHKEEYRFRCLLPSNFEVILLPYFANLDKQLQEVG